MYGIILLKIKKRILQSGRESSRRLVVAILLQVVKFGQELAQIEM